MVARVLLACRERRSASEIRRVAHADVSVQTVRDWRHNWREDGMAWVRRAVASAANGQTGGPLTVTAADAEELERLAHGTDRPRAMAREGAWKLCYSHGDPPEFELYNLEYDPGEFNELSQHHRYDSVRERLMSRIMEVWGDPDALDRRIKNSQRSRLMIRETLGDEAIF